MKDKIKFIYFDLGGVFFEWDKYFNTVANTFGHTQKEFAQMFAKYVSQKYEVGIISNIYEGMFSHMIQQKKFLLFLSKLKFCSDCF